MPGRNGVLANMALQKIVSPQLIRVGEVLGLLTGEVLHPGDCFIGDATGLAGSRQFSQRGFQAELKELSHTQSHAVPVDVIGCGDRAVAHSIGAVQKNGGAQDSLFFFGAGSSKSLECCPLLISEDQGCPLGDEWHKPFWHKNVRIV